DVEVVRNKIRLFMHTKECVEGIVFGSQVDEQAENRQMNRYEHSSSRSCDINWWFSKLLPPTAVSNFVSFTFAVMITLTAACIPFNRQKEGAKVKSNVGIAHRSIREI
nr:hypothetical protein [Tanacetum cinerariifolium]